MKVDVIQVAEATFKSRWHWWSMWIDVAVYDYSCEPFLIQMQVSRTNGKKFRSIKMNGLRYRQATCNDVGDLTPMKR